MEYNLSKESFFYTNTTEGNVSLDIDDLISIMYNTASVTLSGSESAVLCIDVDLGMCISCDGVRYYFNSTSNSGTVASGVSILYKNESFEDYTSLNISIGDGYYLGDVSTGSEFTPRYVRLLHTLSGTIYGDVNGLMILNNEDVVNFGTDGSTESETFTALIDEPVIRTIPVYNSGDRTSTAYVYIEPQNNYVDDIIYISDSQDGPWVGVRESDYTIVDGSSWSDGNYSNTTLLSGRLVLSAGYTTGTYTTSVFNFPFSKYSALDVVMSYDHDTPIVKVDEDDTIETLEIRSSNQKPLNYRAYRVVVMRTQRMTGGYYYRSWYAADYSVEDGSLIENYGDFMRVSTFGDTYDQKSLYTVVAKNRTLYTINAVYRDSYRSYILLCFANNNYTGLSTVSYNNEWTSSDNYVWLYRLDTSSDGWAGGEYYIKHMMTDDQNGLWFYMRIQNDGTSYTTTGGYYLFHFTYGTSLTQDLKLYNSVDYIYDMDVVTEGSVMKIWYIDKTTNDLIKMDKDGVVDVNVNITALTEKIATGVTTADDGGCWVLAAPNVYKFNSDAELEDTLYDVVSDDATEKYISLDRGEDGLWLFELGRLKRIFYDGRTDFEYESSTLSAIVESTDSGVWLKDSGDNKYDFINRSTRTILRSYGSSSMDLKPGMIDYSYDHDTWSRYVPTDKDSVWNNLEWNKVAPDHYSLNEEQYKQLRITLNTDLSTSYYGVDGVYVNKCVEIENIPSNNYKNMYLKTEIPAHDSNYYGNHSSNLKVWWDIPV